MEVIKIMFQTTNQFWMIYGWFTYKHWWFSAVWNDQRLNVTFCTVARVMCLFWRPFSGFHLQIQSQTTMTRTWSLGLKSNLFFSVRSARDVSSYKCGIQEWVTTDPASLFLLRWLDEWWMYCIPIKMAKDWLVLRNATTLPNRFSPWRILDTVPGKKKRIFSWLHLKILPLIATVQKPR